MLEYPEGGQNTFVHRLPSRIKQGNITLKRGVITDENALLDWYQKTVVQAQPVTLVITLKDTADEADPDLELRQRLPRQVDGRRPQRGRRPRS